ncbi:hypothetical protein TNCV_4991851 [Trichonephila clavipes]|nr:hypothetical protein TNCV_4991851 [Trichonephila clavipes]
MHSRSLFGFDFVVFEGGEQKLPVERASDKLAGPRDCKVLPQWPARAIGLATRGLEHHAEGENTKHLYSAAHSGGRNSPVAKVSDGGRLAYEFESNATKDPPCRGVMHVKSVESSNVLLLVWRGS